MKFDREMQIAVSLLLLCIIGAALFTAYWKGYSDGETNGVQNYTHQNCSYYPFLLISPSQYWACKIPEATP